MLGRPEQSPGTEPRPARDISHLTILRSEGVSLLCRPAGNFNAAQDPAAGLYHRDTRYLSRLELLLGNTPLVPLDSQEHGFWLASTLTNPDVFDPYGRVVVAQSVAVHRLAVIDGGLAVALNITNHGKSSLTLPLEVGFAADFEDIFVVRGFSRRSARPAPTCLVGAGSVTYRYTGLDNVGRSVEVQFSGPPAQLEPGRAIFQLELAPGKSIELSVSARIDGKGGPGRPEELIKDGLARRLAWREERTTFESSDERLDSLFQRCLDDLYSLQTGLRGRQFLAAGVPWFDALFGRDSVLAGIAALGVSPAILRDSLILLAEEQATEVDPSRDEEPGKIPHELRFGELANLGEVPFGRYYGSIDSTPLFVIGCREYHRWTGDLDTVRLLLPAAHRAIAWCVTKLRAHPLGALAYHRESANGLEHQGWKDSEDGVCHGDGSAVSGPIALVEVQAYVARALRAYAELCALAGETPAVDIEAPFAAILDLTRERFLVDGEPLLALDGNGQPVRTAASNAGHVLWAGASGERDARVIAERLLQPDLFSGWGIRTLAKDLPAFNPLGYHTGSVWPHDNAVILEGFRRYGMLDEVERLGSALLDAMLGFPDGRIPELFSGDDRDDRPFPTPYPVASRPQAWAAAGLPWTLMTMLGVVAEDSGRLNVVRPRLPLRLAWARLRNVHFGDSVVDLCFRRESGHTSVEVERQTGRGSVVLSGEWPIPLLGQAGGDM